MLYKANTWKVSSSGWWKIHDKRTEKQTKTVCGSGEKFNCPTDTELEQLKLEKLSYWWHRQSVDKLCSEKCIFNGTEMMCTDGKTVIFKCFIIFTNHRYTFTGLYDTQCKNAEMFFFSGFLAFYSSDWRVRGKRFIKCWLGFKPTLYFSHKKQDLKKRFFASVLFYPDPILMLYYG